MVEEETGIGATDRGNFHPLDEEENRDYVSPAETPTVSQFGVTRVVGPSSKA